MSDVGDKLERGGMRGLGVCGEDAEGLECESTLEADLLDALNEAVPVANVGLAVGQVGIGDHVEVVHGVVVVDVEDGHTLAHDLEVVLDVEVAEVSVSDVKAEAEVVAACFLVEDVDHSCGVIRIRKSALDEARTVTTEDILKADLYALILGDVGDKSAVEIEVGLKLNVLFGAKRGMNYDCGAVDVLANCEALVKSHNDVRVERVLILEPAREGRVHLRDLNTRCLACILEGLDPFKDLLDGLVKKSGCDLSRLSHGIGPHIDIDIVVNCLKTAGLDVFKRFKGFIVVIPTARLYANFKHFYSSKSNYLSISVIGVPSTPGISTPRIFA